MKTTIKTIVAALAAFSLASCASNRDNLKLRGGVVGGLSFVSAELDGETDRTDGQDVGGRLEVARRVEDFENTEVGLRVGGFVGELDYEGPGTLDTQNLEVHAVARHYFVDEEELFRPYVEGFAGYSHRFWDINDPGLSEKGDGGGFSGGGGLGLSIGPAFIQLDYTYSAVDIDGVDAGTQDVRVWVGGEVGF